MSKSTLPLERLIEIVARLESRASGGSTGQALPMGFVPNGDRCHIEDAYRTIFENTGTAVLVIEEDTTISITNRMFEKLTGYKQEEIDGRASWTRMVAGDDLERMMRFHELRRHGNNGVPGSYECRMKGINGDYQEVLVSVAMLPGTRQSIASIIDISDLKRTERELVNSRMELEAAYEELIATEEELRNQFLELQQKEKELRYINQHDSLTGLYNRNYFEQEISRLEKEGLTNTSLVLFDIDGLKLVNDSLGHEHGDSMLIGMAGIIAECCSNDNLIARVGGDEFALVIRDSEAEPPANIVRQVIKRVKKYNEDHDALPISVSIGYSSMPEEPCSYADLFKEADNYMQNRKLHSARSVRSSIVSTLVSTLNARDFITEGHTDRLQDIVEMMGREIGLAERSLDDLKLLARFHDIGKVGIPDRILFKAGRLDLEEMSEMRRHSEIGYKIAQAAGELIHISDWILLHHEWWNGNGYPLGIKGEEIPMECRILAIADAYDAMTNDRPYRQALCAAEAITELSRCAGTQFDPYLVEVFCQLIARPEIQIGL